MAGESFSFIMSFDNKVMVLKVHKFGCVWKTPFRKSGHDFAKACKAHFLAAL